MSFTIVSFCPNCGAPIWVQETTPEQPLPPTTHFSCACKPEKLLGASPTVSQPLEVEITVKDTGKRTILND